MSITVQDKIITFTKSGNKETYIKFLEAKRKARKAVYHVK